MFLQPTVKAEIPSPIKNNINPQKKKVTQSYPHPSFRHDPIPKRILRSHTQYDPNRRDLEDQTSTSVGSEF